MTTIKFRRDTSVNWTSVNPIPAQGEPCYETDTGKLKIGNGSDNYVALPYVSDGGGSSGDLPIATATTLGGIKVGDNLSITEDGTLSANGGSAGTTDYTQLKNKPQINSVELTGNKTLDDLGIQAKGDYLTALPDNAVTTDTTQEITGDKTFTKTITTNNITCNNTLMASTIRTKANGTIKLAHPTNNASGMITLDNNYGQLSITNGLSGNNNLLQVVNGTAYATLMGNKIETKDKDGNLYYYINSKNITNCLLEVPQRIKYTLENGILTIKAGTVVIVPYGTEDLTSTYPVGSTFLNDNFKVYDTQYSDGKFFVWVEIVNDIRTSGGTTSTSTLWTILLNIPNNKVAASFTSKAVIDTPTTYGMVYNTTTNVISSYAADSTVATGTNISFPLVLVQSTANGYITSMVYQVFNGMGYIGSIVWVDKGVKGLIPNGRNEDGSFNNIEITTNKITLKNYNSYTLDEYRTLFFVSDFTYLDAINFISGSLANRPTTVNSKKTVVYYCEDENVMYYTKGSTTANWRASRAMSIGNFNVTGNGVITSFNPKLPFRAVDYNDKSEISGWSMPSDKYIDLTLGASGSTYTAPANGYVYVSGTANAVNGRIELVTSKLSTSCISPTKSSPFTSFIPVMNGDVVNINYANVGIGLFRFVYAEGSK